MKIPVPKSSLHIDSPIADECGPLKVLQIAPEYPPYNIGGGGKVVQDISRRLSPRGELAGVLAGYYPTKTVFDRVPPLTDQNEHGAVQVDWLPLIPSSSLALRTYMPPNPLATFTLMRRLLRRNYDLIHMHGYGTLTVSLAAVIARLLRRRYVLTLHGFPRSPQQEKGIVGLFFTLYAKTLGAMTLSGAFRLVAISEAVKEEAVSYGAIENHIVVIPNGIDLGTKQTPSDAGIREYFGLGRSDRIIVSVGACHERKGFQHLISALPSILQKHPDAILMIVGGDGGHKRELNDLVVDLGLKDRVRFTGFVDERVRDSLVREAEVYVIPSLVEPFGLVALEAMSMGKAIVSTRIDGLGEILEDGVTATLVEPADPGQLAAGVNGLLDDPAAARRMSENALQAVSRYDWARVMEQFYALYREAVTSGRRV